MKLHVIYGTIIALLLAGNFWFAYSWLDTGVTLAYRNEEIREESTRFEQLSGALPAIAKGANKMEVVAAMQAGQELDVFEKDGCTWVGLIGLKFDNDRLVHVSPNPNSRGMDPCFPG